MELKKLKLTKIEKEEYLGKKEELRELLINKAVLDTASEYEFSEAEKMELDYIIDGEKVKFYVAKQIEDKILIDESEITKIYSENKKYFDSQKIAFSQAREMINRDLFNNQVRNLENQFILNSIEELKKSIEVTKEEILFSNGNSEILKTIITNKVINQKIKSEKFEKEVKQELDILKSNVLINFYLDIQIRNKISVSQNEVEEIYKKEQKQFVNIPIQDAYNQIANVLFNNKANELREKLVEDIAKGYNIEEVLNENL